MSVYVHGDVYMHISDTNLYIDVYKCMYSYVYVYMYVYTYMWGSGNTAGMQASSSRA